ncbi:MAG: DUF4421 family protein [Prevotella sp.]|nr:DUF4421 family protein [Prevotella sp.]
MIKHLLLGLLVCIVVPVSAQQKDSWAHRTSRNIRQRLDSALFRKVDTTYIEVPKKAWRVILRPKINQIDTRVSSVLDDDLIAKLGESWGLDLTGLHFDWLMKLEQPMSTSVGVWVGYRGLGIGYSQSLTKRSGRYFSLSSTGSCYGVTLSVRSFETDDLSTRINLSYIDEKYSERDDDYDSYAPIKVNTLFLDGYYVFNGKRYSQASAYNQSVIQRRSAGSFLLGLSWYQSSIDLSDKLNGDIILASNNIGKIKVHQGNVGFGYGYNWVPARNWLMNIMVMPTLAFYNRVKVTKYASNYNFFVIESDTEDYGTWDPEKRQWANGKTERPLPGHVYDEEEDLSWQKDVDNWETGAERKYTRWKVNINAQAGITYFGKDWFAGIFGQLHRFSYNHDNMSVKIWDWYVRGSLGIRF